MKYTYCVGIIHDNGQITCDYTSYTFAHRDLMHVGYWLAGVRDAANQDFPSDQNLALDITVTFEG